jgi:hypothetical protein
METRQQYPESDPRHHTIKINKIKRMLNDTIEHRREDGEKVQDPKARALFETSAEVLTGLVKAYTDFEQGRPAWR